jgi:hypothetical protein
MRRLAVHPDGTLFAAYPGEPLYRSSDRGSTWTALAPAQGFMSVAVTAGGSLLAATRLGEVWRSTDRGATWSLVVSTGDCCYTILEVVAGPLGGAAVVTNSGVLLGENDGTTWESFLPTSGRVAFAPDEHSLYVATGTGVERWLEGTSGWAEEEMPAFQAEEIAVDISGRVYAASRTAVAWTVPGDPAWHALGATNCNDGYLEQASRLVLGGDGDLYWGTSCDGVYRSRLQLGGPTAIGDGEGKALLTWGAVPNPSRDTSTLAFTLAGPSRVNVSVYDVRGRLVATLANGEQFTSGVHALRWIPAAGTPSGVYSYRIRAGDGTRSGRIVLVR